MIGSSGASLRDRRDDLRAQDRVRVHDRPLFPGEPFLLEQDVVGHADLADVMEQPAPLERLELGVADAHHPPDVDRDLLHPMAVLRRVRVALVDGLGQGADRLREHLAHLDEPLVGHRASCTAAPRRGAVAHHPSVEYVIAPSATRAAPMRRSCRSRPRMSAINERRTLDRSRSATQRRRKNQVQGEQDGRADHRVRRTCQWTRGLTNRDRATNASRRWPAGRCQRGSRACRTTGYGLAVRGPRWSQLQRPSPPAAGPPRFIATRTGASRRRRWSRRAAATGSADARSVMSDPEDDARDDSVSRCGRVHRPSPIAG